MEKSIIHGGVSRKEVSRKGGAKNPRGWGVETLVGAMIINDWRPIPVSLTSFYSFLYHSNEKSSLFQIAKKHWQMVVSNVPEPNLFVRFVKQ